MSFTSLEFYAALTIAALVFYQLPQVIRTWFLLGASYLFYAFSDQFYLVVLIAATVLAYVAGQMISRSRSEAVKLRILFISVLLLVAALIFFKLASKSGDFLLPLGISFFSFKLISYLVEVYWDERAVEREVAIFFLYPAFFPQIVSGPIQRPGPFLAQWRSSSVTRPDYRTIEEGFRLILAGLAMKLLVADRLASFIDIVDQSPTHYQQKVVVVLLICYTLQLYADFSGYTNIALGIGKIFGISGPANFAAPFAASNIQKLWQRWHMSLTSWVTDYLFVPLSMALRRFGRAGMLVSLSTSMVVIGLWHGLTINFLIFGLWHATFVGLTALSARWRDRLFSRSATGRIVALSIGIVLTFLLMTISLVFWHNAYWSDAIERFRVALSPSGSGTLGFAGIRTDVVEPLWICMLIAVYAGLGAPGWRPLKNYIDRIIPNWMQYGLCLLMISALTIENGTAFVYGQF